MSILFFKKNRKFFRSIFYPNYTIFVQNSVFYYILCKIDIFIDLYKVFYNIKILVIFLTLNIQKNLSQIYETGIISFIIYLTANIFSTFLYNGKITTVMIAPFTMLNGTTSQIMKLNKSVTLGFNTVPI